jgi:hypothetical protein
LLLLLLLGMVVDLLLLVTGIPSSMVMHCGGMRRNSRHLAGDSELQLPCHQELRGPHEGQIGMCFVSTVTQTRSITAVNLQMNANVFSTNRCHRSKGWKDTGDRHSTHATQRDEHQALH